MDLENLDQEIKKFISNINIDLFDKNIVLKGLSDLIHNSVKTNIKKDTKFGLAFSGGVD